MLQDWEIWNALIERVASNGVASLNTLQFVAYRVNAFLCDLENSGLSGVLYNLSPQEGEDPTQWSELFLTAAALREIGSQASAEALTFCAGSLESAVQAEETNWGEFLAGAIPAEVLDGLEETTIQESAKTWELLSAFTNQNQEGLHCA